MKTRAFVVLAACCLTAFTGCNTIRPAAKSPETTATAGGVSLSQSGDAAQPAHASETTTTTATVIPPGVPVTWHADGSVTFTPAAPLNLTTTRSEASATGPAAFTPPTPTEEAAGRASLWMRLGLVAGIALGVFGIVRGWDLVGYGGGAIAAGCVAGLALASVPPWLWAVFGVGAAACIIGPALWHTRLKKETTPTPTS
jgi:hypothetical protein